MAPSRRISQRPGPRERSTIVVGCAWPVGPPSMISGIRSPIWSRTQAAWVHSGSPLQIGRGCRDRQAKALDNGAGNGCVGHAQGDVAGVGRGAQGQLGAGAHDDGERTGPEAVGQLVQLRVGVARQLVGLGEPGDEQRERLVLLAGLDPVDLLDGGEIDRVHSQAVEGVGRQSDNIALAETGDDVVDPVRLGFVGMDAQNFRGQSGLPWFLN